MPPRLSFSMNIRLGYKYCSKTTWSLGFSFLRVIVVDPFFITSEYTMQKSLLFHVFRPQVIWDTISLLLNHFQKFWSLWNCLLRHFQCKRKFFVRLEQICLQKCFQFSVSYTVSISLRSWSSTWNSLVLH